MQQSIKKISCSAFFALACFCVVSLTANAQTPNIRWQRFFGGDGRDEASAMAATNDGGYVIAGSTRSVDGDITMHHGDKDHTDYWVIKIDGNGQLEWQRSLGGNDFDEAHAIATFADGGIVIAGESRSNDGDVTAHHGTSEFADAWIVKLDAQGTLLWQRSLGGTDYDAAFAVCATNNGGIVIAGSSNSNDGDVSGHHGSSDFADAWVARLTSEGDILWQHSLGGTDNDEAHAVIALRDGGFAVAGSSRSADGDVPANRGGDDAWIAKLDASGVLLWSRTAGGTGNDGATSLAELYDGRLALAGYTYSDDGNILDHHGSTYASDVLIALFDKSGALISTHSYGGSRNDVANALAATPNGLVIAGSSESGDGDVGLHAGTIAPDGWMFAIDTTGAILWEKAIGTIDRDVFTAITPAHDGWVLAGTAHTFAETAVRHADDDFWIVHVAIDSAAVAMESGVPVHGTVYPNPFHDEATITLPANTRDAQLMVYDLAGRLVLRIIDINTDHVIISRDNMRKGTFVYRIVVSATVIMEGRFGVE